ncbi:hypothetical protein DICSQDRAFT_173212 [Dichomitus squalens LYAD-421 SS1]|uniref:Uncharacterized protein n=1 Tax=Dichomitus squalens (strain LYAD-421) TaxID=732165 RepID=R7SPU2_DICSQ|nr:uncharacterized protein DICSQDRAFT_173212 [Dichomitus squalens LYAD-421 SS1]EJF58116.1 hypothetical protein DICSQDRAFT_173212 [Dichomitus squalens LYAD-421 SS1]
MAQEEVRRATLRSIITDEPCAHPTDVLPWESLYRSPYTAHAPASQTFVERVKLFRTPINYINGDSGSRTDVDDPAVCTYRLSRLDDKYPEYVELLAAQTVIKQAVAFHRLVPFEYIGATGSPYNFALGPVCLLEAANEGLTRNTALAIAGPAVPATAALTPVLRIPHSDGYSAQYGVPALCPNSLNVNLRPRLRLTSISKS